MKLKGLRTELPETLTELKMRTSDEISQLWAHYFPGGRPQIKPLWWKIQCDLNKTALNQRYITKLNTYSQNPDACVANSQKTKYHIKPGTQLTKRFKGIEHSVIAVTESNFLYNGEIYKTLSAIATHICGHKVSGYDFFGFNNKGTTTC